MLVLYFLTKHIFLMRVLVYTSNHAYHDSELPLTWRYITVMVHHAIIAWNMINKKEQDLKNKNKQHFNIKMDYIFQLL